MSAAKAAATARRYAHFVDTCDWYPALARDLVRRLGPDRLASAIDLCAGTGAVSAALVRSMPANGRVLAVDRSPDMLEQARSRVIDPRVDWLVAAAEDVDDWAPVGVDAALCSGGIWCTDVPIVLAGLHRSLRPGGRLAVNLPPGPDPLRYRAALAGAGFVGIDAEPVHYALTVRDARRWLDLEPGNATGTERPAWSDRPADDVLTARWWVLTARVGSGRTGPAARDAGPVAGWGHIATSARAG